MSDALKATPSAKRDYAIFEADISGAVLNMQLLRRLLRWLAPYKAQLFLSTVLVLLLPPYKFCCPSLSRWW